jgi:hypothetical protein
MQCAFVDRACTSNCRAFIPGSGKCEVLELVRLRYVIRDISDNVMRLANKKELDW